MPCSVKLGVAIAALAILTAMESESRELRPSDHGFGYSPAGNTTEAPAEAKSFFSGGGGGGGESPGGVALPKAMNSNSNDTSWWEGVNAREGGRDHVREVLVVVSLVCGITGVLLFVVSAFVYLLRHRNHKAPPPS